MTTGGGGEPTFADVLNGLTFGGRRGHRRAQPETRPPDDPSPGQGPMAITLPLLDDGPPVVGGPWQDPTPRYGAASPHDQPTYRAAVEGVDATADGAHEATHNGAPGTVNGVAVNGAGSSGAAVGGGAPWVGEPGWEDQHAGSGEEVAAIVRPYAWTRGRTRSSIELRVETLVSAVGEPGAGSPLEHREIAELCRTPHSVAEVAALLRVPLGVAKVLVSDMAETGRLTVHRAGDGTQAHFVLMERVLSGLRRL